MNAESALATESFDSEPITPESIAELRARVTGPVFARGDQGAAAEVACFNRSRTQDPDVVVGATNDADVVAAVRFAVQNRLLVRIQATGHGSGKTPAGGMMITTRRMDTLQLDPRTRLATIGAGVQWQRVVETAAAFELAPIVGSSVTVGAVGYTLGGGLGPLARSHGFSSDWVRGFRVVTAAGDIITADAHSNPDLFWALRGGKGGFGVVTEMTIELAPMPALYVGGLLFEGAKTSGPRCAVGPLGCRMRRPASRHPLRCCACRRAATHPKPTHPTPTAQRRRNMRAPCST
ncbi:MAG TPA: FAD-binding oxidoreductase [Microbacteriaceae bacterium]